LLIISKVRTFKHQT